MADPCHWLLHSIWLHGVMQHAVLQGSCRAHKCAPAWRQLVPSQQESTDLTGSLALKNHRSCGNSG